MIGLLSVLQGGDDLTQLELRHDGTSREEGSSRDVNVWSHGVHLIT
jgi:hypothetical protein